MSQIILGLSILVQFVSAGLALQLIRISGHKAAWGFIALALTLMGIRRSITLYRVTGNDQSLSADFTAELVALFISVLMLCGVIMIGKLFRDFQ